MLVIGKGLSRIVPLDRSADRAGNDRSAQLDAVFVFGKVRKDGVYHGGLRGPRSSLD